MKMGKMFSKAYWHRKYMFVLEKFQSPNLYWERARELYFNMTGKWLNYRHPVDINQKLMWLTRYWQHPLKTQCADKYLVRNYVKSLQLDNILIPLIGVWENADSIDFESLPEKFVLKCNHGSGYNVICTNKNTLNFDVVRRQLNEWMSIDYENVLYELHYKNIPRRIVCEEFISKNNVAPVEYQFWCINGEPESILVCRKNFDNTYDAASYSLEWERLFDRKEEDANVVFEKPACGIEILADYARMLAKPFPFVRLDLYVVGEKAYLAEMTFTPSNNILSKYKQSFLDRLGEKLQLPEKYIP